MTRIIMASLLLLFACATAPGPHAQERPAAQTDGQASALPWLRLDDLSATRDRPLFARDRRPRPSAPPPPPAEPLALAEPEPEPQKPAPPALKGIIVQDASTLVLLEDQASAEQVFVRSGDSFGPWRVIAASDHRVTLAAGGEQVVLDLNAPAP
jgi:hypothetical protein